MYKDKIFAVQYKIIVQRGKGYTSFLIASTNEKEAKRIVINKAKRINRLLKCKIKSVIENFYYI